MNLEEELLAIETVLWTGGAEEYRENLDDQCLLAFSGMAGVKGRDEVAATVEGPDRWRDVEIEVAGVLRPSTDVAILTYEASAVRGAEERYRALVSSGYVRRDRGWKLMFHQQTPVLTQAAGASLNFSRRSLAGAGDNSI